MYAYDRSYLEGAQTAFGSMLDTAVNGLGENLACFYQLFLKSQYAARFGAGDPAIIAGRSGRELAFEVLGRRDVSDRDFSSTWRPLAGASPEYWCGWAVAFYQWASCFSFAQINERVPIERVFKLYHPYHEMDIRQFCDRMNELALAAHPKTELQARRLAAGLSQRSLAQSAGLPVRTLQQYEQRQKDINRARADYVVALARCLACAPEDLLEHRASDTYDYAAVAF